MDRNERARQRYQTKKEKNMEPTKQDVQAVMERVGKYKTQLDAIDPSNGPGDYPQHTEEGGVCTGCLETRAFTCALIDRIVSLSYTEDGGYACLMFSIINSLMQHAPQSDTDRHTAMEPV
jgi:hypothetical protein